MKKINILHISNDDKFIDAAYYLYEKAFPLSNKVIITIPNKNNYNLKYIKHNKFIVKRKNVKNLKEISKEMEIADIIVFHSFDNFKANLTNNKVLKKIIYTVWGFEIYTNNYKLILNNYEKETLKYLNKNTSKIKKQLKPFYYFIRGTYQSFFNNKFKKLKKLKYISILHREDYELFQKKNIINKKARHLIFTYYPIEFIFKENKNSIVNGNNILIGNSATYTNNHLDIFQKIKNLDLGERKIIIPLNYGNKEYAKDLIVVGKKYFNNFYPLLDFMSLPEYNKRLQTCNIIIMNHVRQQGVGNILTGLWLGAKLFMNHKSTFYNYLKRIGCIVYSIDELNDNLLTPLTLEQIEYNRSILVEEIRERRIINEIKKDIYYIITNK